MTTDSELLRRYANQGDEAAFTEVVLRQTDFVYSAALRVTGNAQLAQDVTQAVFTKLGQEAGRVGHFESILGWLHAYARHRAIDAVRGEERRRAREQEASTMQNISSEPDAHWEKLRSLVDEAVSQLRDQDREAVLLRFFKGLSHQEVGTALGLSENAAQKRVDRALEKLRASFVRQRVVMSAALLASILTANSVKAAPVGLAESMAGASLAGTGLGAESLWIKILFMSTKTKLVVAAAIVAIVVTLTIHWPSAASLPSRRVASGVSVPASTIKPAVANQVEKPAQLAATPSVQPINATTAIASPVYVAGPQTDLKTAISAGIYFLQSQDPLSYYKTLVPQKKALNAEGKPVSLANFEANFSQAPDAAEKLSSMLQELISIQTQTPDLNPEGTRATYKVSRPDGGHLDMIFSKMGDYWYLVGYQPSGTP